MTFREDQQRCNSELLRLTESWFMTCKPDRDELAAFRYWREYCEMKLLKLELTDCENGINSIKDLYESVTKSKVIQEELL